MNSKCPKCDYKKLKTWDELNDVEKLAFKVKPTIYKIEQRKKHRFCVRCEFEEGHQERIV